MTLLADAVERLDEPWKRFIGGLYKIVDKQGRIVPFVPNVTQEELAGLLHGRDIILKARQRGITTLMCIVALDECLFTPNWNAAIIAHRLIDAKTIFDTKVRFPYDNLDEGLRAIIPTVRDASDTLHFANGSSISVTTSARSGTLQRLHISEFGKICAQFPVKAREIVTGSFPAAEMGAITIESTAEGQEGRFFEMTQTARAMAGRQLGPKDWRFHFFPWWSDPDYTTDPGFATLSPEDHDYFEKLEIDDGIALTDGQKAWWVLTERDQGGDMKREYPATADEAFEQAIEGAYFERQLAHSSKHGAIGRFPHDPRYPVNSFWDLGRNDYNVIWLHQHIKNRNVFIGYHEQSGEYIAHYIRWLREWRRDNDAEWGTHYWPHDGGRQDEFLEHGRLAVVEDMGFAPRIVERPADKGEAIEAARNVFSTCDFDEAGCATGLKRLRHYRKEWDEQRGVWRDRPRHDDNSHGADAFMTFATGFEVPTRAEPIKMTPMGTIA